ncbi:hypothetical protein C7974DRAFT_418186 [Boeremia exigua]|uniref:uncharacterized protein n=1 Tax=Boeremia exigua TaxID=749465 RepID=UPI001E8EE798|nr:uncharacterized protein C7974DRAFT_418186 [Boeremia exigua]KAH6613097.1 hypothetical protein C7974DRAFT_418186 [Boeremia exigua]
MTTDTPVNALTRELAQYLESADVKGTSITAQRKRCKEIFQRLEPLRATALSAEIESLYNVGAWYQLFGYPPKFPSWADPNDARVFAGSRLVSALTSLKKEWKQIDTVPKIRAAARDEIPLPTWPGRDFLDKLVKIAGAGAAGYPLDTFLQEFPRFLHTKIGVTHKPQYFRKESRRCVLCPELNEFYDNIVQPWIIGLANPTTSSRKRRKADVVGRSIDTSLQAGDEPPEPEAFLWSNEHEHELGQTILESSPGLQNTESIQQSSRSRPQHSDQESTEHETQIEDPELEITIDHSLLDDDSGQQISDDYDDQIGVQLEAQQSIPKDHTSKAPRRANGAKATQDERAQKEVEGAFDVLLELDDDTQYGARWLVDNTKLRISLRRQIEIAKVSVDAAADDFAKTGSEIASRLPPNTNLSQSIANTEARLAKFTANEVRLLEQQKLLQALADDMDDDDMCILNTRTVVNQDALVARKTGIEHEIALLKGWEAQLNEQYKSQEKKKKDLEELQVRLDERNESLETMALLFRLATQPSSCGAFEVYVAAKETK